MKTAVLSMDIEDWYHLDYFKRDQCDESYSMLDGLDIYREILTYNKIVSSFFVLGELAEPLHTILRGLVKENHEIGSHGWDHIKPMKIGPDSFFEDLTKSKNAIENILGVQIEGYRAPCFSMNRERLDLVKKVG